LLAAALGDDSFFRSLSLPGEPEQDSPLLVPPAFDLNALPPRQLHTILKSGHIQGQFFKTEMAINLPRKEIFPF
jgi:hypothetical protein